MAIATRVTSAFPEWKDFPYISNLRYITFLANQVYFLQVLLNLSKILLFPFPSKNCKTSYLGIPCKSLCRPNGNREGASSVPEKGLTVPRTAHGQRFSARGRLSPGSLPPAFRHVSMKQLSSENDSYWWKMLYELRCVALQCIQI